MKIGTIMCWLFGHKFIQWRRQVHNIFGCTREWKEVTNHCVRCGIKRETEALIK